MKFFRAANQAGTLLSLILWTACQSSKSEEQGTSAAEKAVVERSPARKQAEALAKQFGPIIKGAWVKADYLVAVQQTKSPLRASDLAGPVSEIIINPVQGAADSLVAGLGLGNHEGGSMTVYFRPGSHSAALPTSYIDYDKPGSSTELSYQLSARDTALMLTTYSKSRKVLAQAVYQRVRGASLTDLAALNFAVRQLFFAGQYNGVDSLGGPVRIEFTGNGRVKGLKGFHSYDVNTDFGGGIDIDHISLDSDTRHSREMVYHFKADTLRLYAAHWVEDGVPTLKQGGRLFTLVRN